MAKYRQELPLKNDDYFLSDGGLETALIFHEHISLPQFAAFPLLQDTDGRMTLVEYFLKYISIAKKYGIGFILESPTWRASSKWGELLGYSTHELSIINKGAIKLLTQIRSEHECDKTKIIISGCIGPMGDGYVIEEKMSVAQAETYHAPQINTFSCTEADIVTAHF